MNTKSALHVMQSIATAADDFISQSLWSTVKLCGVCDVCR